ncbi:MAG TPA: glycoside hydrolase N-terminal domain-containing protein, partial [Allocoleopsis sp.]
EVFVSAPANIIVMHISASQSKNISLHISTRSALRYNSFTHNGELILKGKAPAHVDPSYFNANKNPIIYDDPTRCKGMRFEMIVKPVVKDGTMEFSDNQININHASEVMLMISAATSFNGFDHCPDKQGVDEHALAQSILDKASQQSFKQLLSVHEQDFHHYFDRVNLALNPDETDHSSLSTDQRLANYTRGDNDSALEALYFQYGRYLLISASRTRNAPANLQGIWNKDVRPPWSSNYTTNINLEMNYWPMESANLDEMFVPLDDLISHLAVTGHETAKSFYHAPGWVLHHNSDIWAMSNPVGDLGKGDPTWANWYMGGNWLCRHLWEHYLFTG